MIDFFFFFFFFNLVRAETKASPLRNQDALLHGEWIQVSNDPHRLPKLQPLRSCFVSSSAVGQSFAKIYLTRNGVQIVGRCARIKNDDDRH